MMPTTVPNRPMNGVMFAERAEDREEALELHAFLLQLRQHQLLRSPCASCPSASSP